MCAVRKGLRGAELPRAALGRPQRRQGPPLPDLPQALPVAALPQPAQGHARTAAAAR